MRRFGALVFTIACVLVIASCGKNEAPSTGPGNAPPPGKASSAGPHAARRIVFVFKSAGQYSEVCKQGAMQADKELKPQNVTVEYLAPDTADVSKQISILDQKIADKVDAIVISPNNADAVVPIIKKAMDSGVKVFTWDSDAAKSQRIFYVAAADDVQIGVDIANALAKDIAGKGKVQIMSGGQGADNLKKHVDGMEQGFAKYPQITLLKPYLYNEEDVLKATNLATTALQANPDIAGFACANSQGPPGVAEAITKLNKVGQIKVWGLSLPSQTRPYLKSGAIAGIMLWDPAKLTYLTARLVNDFLDGKQPEDGMDYPGIGKISFKNAHVLMPGVTFTKENVDQYNF